ncbi:MAG: acylphosphatase [Solirubrobacteraceae bacterium]
MPVEPIRRRVVVRGRVQGVFFRDSVRRRALSEGVSGWVGNREDGAVEALVEGAPDAVQAVIDFCAEGPSRAEVRDVEVIDESVGAGEPLRGFEVR